MGRMDSALSFAPTVESIFGQENVIVVKDAHNGQPIRRWYKGWKPKPGEPVKPAGVLYDSLIAKVREAIGDSGIKTVTFIWMQGERDARVQYGDVYPPKFNWII